MKTGENLDTRGPDLGEYGHKHSWLYEGADGPLFKVLSIKRSASERRIDIIVYRYEHSDHVGFSVSEGMLTDKTPIQLSNWICTTINRAVIGPKKNPTLEVVPPEWGEVAY